MCVDVQQSICFDDIAAAIISSLDCDCDKEELTVAKNISTTFVHLRSRYRSRRRDDDDDDDDDVGDKSTYDSLKDLCL